MELPIVDVCRTCEERKDMATICRRWPELAGRIYLRYRKCSNLRLSVWSVLRSNRSGRIDSKARTIPDTYDAASSGPRDVPSLLCAPELVQSIRRTIEAQIGANCVTVFDAAYSGMTQRQIATQTKLTEAAISQKISAIRIIVLKYLESESV